MKLYESAYTYIPFVYFLLSGLTFALLFHHNEKSKNYKPYLILMYLLLNTAVQFYFKTDHLIKNVIHKHVWKTITLGIYGIIFNATHEVIFEDFNIDKVHINYIVSLLYITSMFINGYYFKKNSFLIYTHIIALFFPIDRTWQINLYLYIIYMSVCIFIMFSKCSEESLMNDDLYRNPVIKFFVYLRINDLFVLLGIIQLYLEYYALFIPELQAIEEIEHIMEVQRRKVEKNSSRDII